MHKEYCFKFKNMRGILLELCGDYPPILSGYTDATINGVDVGKSLTGWFYVVNMNPQSSNAATKEDRIMITDYETQIAEYNRAVAGNVNTWVAAAGGKEPISEIDGRHYQMMFNPCTKEHGYYCFETDMFPAYEELPACITGPG